MLPERSAAARSARTVFYEDFNDIDIYVEDTAEGYEKIYCEIFSRVFHGQYRVYNVFPLGDRGCVINECEQNQGLITRPSLYIIDGDFFILTDAEEYHLHGLYRLPQYCIENSLIDSAAVEAILNEEDVKRDIVELRTAFGFDDWVLHNNEVLTELFVEYAVARILDEDIQTVGYPVRKFVLSDRGILDKEKVQSRICKLKDELIAKAGEEKYLQERALIQARIEAGGFDSTQVASGKDYLVPLLFMRIKSTVNSKTPYINLKLRLAMRCDISRLMDAVQSIAIPSLNNEVKGESDRSMAA